MASSQHHRVQVLLDGESVDAPSVRYTPQHFQEQIRRSKTRFDYALCSCQGKPLKLVIKERNGKVFLAAWPDQAGHHALDCPFFSETRNATDSLYSGRAIERFGDQTHLQLEHSFLHENRYFAGRKGAVSAAVRPEEAAAGSRDNLRDSMHMWGLLHYLWEEAGLNRWFPGWHRDWGLVRYLIRKVAQSTVIDGRQLIESIFIPPVWISSKKREIEEHWRQFCAPLLANHRRSRLVASGIVVGTVRILEKSEYGHMVQLHHHSAKFFMDDNLSDSAARFSRRGWAAAKHLEVVTETDEKPYIVAAMRVEASSTGVMNVVEIALMRVSPRFIPVDSSYEDKLAKLLLQQDREFSKPLHYDRHNLAMPDFILRDALLTDESGQEKRTSVAMYVYGPSNSPSQKPKVEAVDRKYAKEHGLGYWQWDVARQRLIPPLPERLPRKSPKTEDHPST